MDRFKCLESLFLPLCVSFLLWVLFAVRVVLLKTWLCWGLSWISFLFSQPLEIRRSFDLFEQVTHFTIAFSAVNLKQMPVLIVDVERSQGFVKKVLLE